MTDKNYQKVSRWLNQSPELDEELKEAEQDFLNAQHMAKDSGQPGDVYWRKMQDNLVGKYQIYLVAKEQNEARQEAFDAWWRLLSEADKERLGRICDES